MNEPVICVQLKLLPPSGAKLVLRQRTLSWYAGQSLFIADAQGTRSFQSDWAVQRHELTPDGRYLLALGDDGKRAQIWEISSGRPLVDLVGDPERRQSLRVGFATIGGELFVCVARASRKTALSIVSLSDAKERAWLSTSGMIGFHVESIVQLGPDWVGIHGFRHAEQYDTVVAIPAGEMLNDSEILQTALRERPSVQEWGYRVTLGPAGPGQAVIFRDPEWDADDLPDDPEEAFSGFAIWNLATARVLQRIPQTSTMLNGAVIGSNERLIAAELSAHIEIISRETAEVQSIEGVALDPYSMEIARFEGDTLIVSRIRS